MAARRQEREDAAERAPRSTWKGTLKLSLIQIPIRVFPATNPASDVRFRQLHRKCHTPIQLKKWCPHCNEEVPQGDIVRGYEVSKGRFSIVEDEEIQKLARRAMLERKDVEEIGRGEPGAPTKVVDLRDALRRSLERARQHTHPAARVLSHTMRVGHKRRKAS